jgi:hypothetical protein
MQDLSVGKAVMFGDWMDLCRRANGCDLLLCTGRGEQESDYNYDRTYHETSES